MDKLHQVDHDVRAELRRLHAENETLRAKLAEAEKDAERHRWFAKQFGCNPDMSGNHTWWLKHHYRLRGPTLAAAIDAARKVGP